MAAPMWKPVRGTALLAKRKRSADRVSAEQAIMREAKRLDGFRCRNPRCENRSKKLPIDPCHKRESHRGIGGNPKGDRTTLETVISLDRVCHGLYDAGLLDIEPLTAKGFRGPCSWYQRDPETGRSIHIATEKRP